MADLSTYSPIYIRTSGNDTTGNGSLAAPFATAQKGFEAAYLGTGNFVLDLGEGSFGGVNLANANATEWPSRIAVRGIGVIDATVSPFQNNETYQGNFTIPWGGAGISDLGGINAGGGYLPVNIIGSFSVGSYILGGTGAYLGNISTRASVTLTDCVAGNINTASFGGGSVILTNSMVLDIDARDIGGIDCGGAVTLTNSIARDINNSGASCAQAVNLNGTVLHVRSHVGGPLYLNGDESQPYCAVNALIGILDCNGVCGDGTNVWTDCYGNRCGSAPVDCNGVCDGSAVMDCAGICGGSAVVDWGGQCCDGNTIQCGMCNHPGPDCTGHCDRPYENFCICGELSYDCDGVCGGSNFWNDCYGIQCGFDNYSDGCGTLCGNCHVQEFGWHGACNCFGEGFYINYQLTTLPQSGTGWWNDKYWIGGAETTLPQSGTGWWNDKYWIGGVETTLPESGTGWWNDKYWIGAETTLPQSGTGWWNDKYWIGGVETTLNENGTGWWSNKYWIGGVETSLDESGTGFWNEYEYRNGEIYDACSDPANWGPSDGWGYDCRAGSFQYRIGGQNTTLPESGTGWWNDKYWIGGAETSLDENGNGTWNGQQYQNGQPYDPCGLPSPDQVLAGVVYGNGLTGTLQAGGQPPSINLAQLLGLPPFVQL